MRTDRDKIVAEELAEKMKPVKVICWPGNSTTWWYVCKGCKTAVDPNDKFCRGCGRPLIWRENKK